MPAVSTIRRYETLADVLDHLGDIPPERVLLNPPPGKATVKDVIRYVEAANKRLVELVDGVLVEKAMGAKESFLACLFIHWIISFLDEHDLGICLGESGTLRILPKQVRIPDVCFISWERLPNHEVPQAPIPKLAPNLAIEVISESNTRQEMLRKLRDYIKAGVELVWFVYPKKKQVVEYTSQDDSRVYGIDDTLDGGDVLPGFQLPVRKLFTHRQRRRS